MEEADKCPEIGFEPNSKQKIHSLVVSYHQQSQRKYLVFVPLGADNAFPLKLEQLIDPINYQNIS